MRRSASWIVLVLAAAGGLALLLWSSRQQPARSASVPRPERPETPPVPGRDAPRPIREPQLPPDRSRIHAAAYAQAKAAGDERPGERAFRATVDAFIAYNKEFAEAQAAKEGLTVAEVHELTYFGFLVLQTQQWSEVQDLIGRELDAHERELGEQLMQESNSEFKAAIRKLTQSGASEPARRQLIADAQERYKKEYFAITGMTPELLDDLLAGDASRPGAPSVTPVPKSLTPVPAPPPVPPRPLAPPPPL